MSAGQPPEPVCCQMPNAHSRATASRMTLLRDGFAIGVAAEAGKGPPLRDFAGVDVAVHGVTETVEVFARPRKLAC